MCIGIRLWSLQSLFWPVCLCHSSFNPPRFLLAGWNSSAYPGVSQYIITTMQLSALSQPEQILWASMEMVFLFTALQKLQEAYIWVIGGGHSPVTSAHYTNGEKLLLYSIKNMFSCLEGFVDYLYGCWNIFTANLCKSLFTYWQLTAFRFSEHRDLFTSHWLQIKKYTVTMPIGFPRQSKVQKIKKLDLLVNQAFIHCMG